MVSKSQALTGAAWATMVAVVTGIVFLDGWLFMLLMGAIHSFFPPAPALGYWHSIAWLVLAWLVIRFISTAWKGLAK